jgi:hypothetical protein
MDDRMQQAELLTALRLKEFNKRLETGEIAFAEAQRRHEEELKNRAAFT